MNNQILEIIFFESIFLILAATITVVKILRLG